MDYKSFISLIYFCIISFLCLGQNNQLAVSEPIMVDESYSLYQAGDFFLAGQPDQEDLDSLIDNGMTLVVNLRTADELSFLSFDEEKYLKKRKIDYIHIPMGGNDGYPPEAIEKMNKMLKSAEGKVLIHCRGAGRATYAWMAWLIRFQSYSIDEAILLGSKARFSVPFFDLLGFPITIQKK